MVEHILHTDDVSGSIPDMTTKNNERINMLSIKEMVSNNKVVNFVKLYDDQLWYCTEDGFEFPVPIEETKGAQFKNQDKAMIFMRWIRKHIQFLQESKE